MIDNKKKKQLHLWAQLEEGLLPLRSNELKIIKGALAFDNLTNKGWVSPTEIFKKGGYKSQPTNIWNDTNLIMELGILEKKYDKKADDRGRIPKLGRPFYRIIPSIDVLTLLKMIQEKSDIGLNKSKYPLLIDIEEMSQYLTQKELIDLYTLEKEEKYYKWKLSQIQPRLAKLKQKIQTSLKEAKKSKETRG